MRRATSPTIHHAFTVMNAYAKYTFKAEKHFETFWGPRVRYTYDTVFYNCYGNKIRRIDIYGWGKRDLPEGVLVDLRTLQLIKQGCCPDELSIDMIEGYE